MGEIIKAYKGFNKDMTCRGFQYEEGKEYEAEIAKACDTGFHACEYPLDVFRHYEPAKSIFHEVELSGDFDKQSDKIAATKIKIGASVNIAGLVKAAIEYTNAKIKNNKTSDKNYGASSNTGYRGIAEAGHPNSVAIAWGTESKAKGVIGSFLVLAEWKAKGNDYWKEESWDFVGSQMVRVDGEHIKEYTLYWLQDGKVTEWKEEE